MMDKVKELGNPNQCASYPKYGNSVKEREFLNWCVSCGSL